MIDQTAFIATVIFLALLVSLFALVRSERREERTHTIITFLAREMGR